MYAKQRYGKGMRALFLLALLLVVGCQKTRFETVLGATATMDQARAAFGEPDATDPLPDGTTRYAWKIDRVEMVPGRWVEEVVNILHDSDGYPVEVIRRYFAPAHYERRGCLLVLEADASGNILRSSWAGNSCGALLYPDRQDYDAMETGGSLDSLEEGQGVKGEPWY